MLKNVNLDPGRLTPSENIKKMLMWGDTKEGKVFWNEVYEALVKWEKKS